MKTIKKWLETLPEPYRSQALKNFENDHDYKEYINESRSELSSALNWAFHWDQTPEGKEYWSKLYYDCQRPEFLTIIEPKEGAFHIQVSSSNKGECCDFYPPGSIHEVKRDEERGLIDLKHNVCEVFPFVKYKVIDKPTETKECPCCNNDFPTDWPFIEIKRTGHGPCCQRCYCKRYFSGDWETFIDLIKQQELKLK